MNLSLCVRVAVLCAVVACIDSREASVTKAPHTSLAGPGDSTVRVRELDSLVARGESLHSRAEFDSARIAWQVALDRARGSHHPAQEARILTGLGLAAYRLGDYAAARTNGERALSIKLRYGLHSDLFKSYNALGLLAWNQGRHEDAVRLYQLASDAAGSQGDEASLAKAANNLGLVHSELGNFAQARAGFEETRRFGHRTSDPLIEGRALNNLGMLDIKIGDPRSAVQELTLARALYRKAGDKTGEQNALGQLGTAYDEMGEPRLALAALDSALTLSRAQGLRQEEASNLELIAAVQRKAGRPRAALELFRRADAIDRELDLQVERGINLRSSAEIQSSLGRPDLALVNLTKAIAVHRLSGARLEEMRDLLLVANLESTRAGTEPSVRTWLARADSLGAVLGARIARVEIALGKAAIREHQGKSSDVIRILQAAQRDIIAGGYWNEWAAEAMLARAYARTSRLDSAARAGRRAVAAVERVRNRLGSSVLRSSFAADKSAPYSDLVDILLRTGLTEEAFEVADAVHSRALLENVATADRESAGSAATVHALGESEAVLRRIDALVARLNAVETTPVTERDPQTISLGRSIATELGTLRDSYEDLMATAAERDPAGMTLLAGRAMNASRVRASLAPDEALVEYLVAEDKLFVFVAVPGRVRAITSVMRRDDLIRRVRIARDVLGRKNSDAAAADGVLATLHSVLIAPLERAGLLVGVRRLDVVPHGTLSYLPFAALRKGPRGRYMIEQYAVTQLPSAAARVMMERTVARPVESRVATAVAFAPFSRELPGSVREIRAIGQALAGTIEVLSSDASERRLRQELSRGDLIHVATHGVMNPLNPMFSRIELARGSDDPTNDGRLEVHELLSMRVQARLVFLSGCETGLGPAWSTQFTTGEDYATLAQAFLYAGARAVASTLWRIDDDGAAVIAARFYAGLDRLGPAEALAAAQREAIHSVRYRSPYYWAGYQISGLGPSPATHKAGRVSVVHH